MGYEKVEINDEEALKSNLRESLIKFNEKKLKRTPLTDKEFNRILIYLEDKTIFKSAKLFRDKYVIEREDGTSVYIEFFDKKNYHNNIF